MAKSLRSKVKRSFRSKKRESGKYAAAEAARLDRIHGKLVAAKDRARPVGDEDPDEDRDTGAEEMDVVEGGQPQGAVSNAVQDGEEMVLDERAQTDVPPTSISTHGSRGSRREEWRKSKGMNPIPKRHGMNRQGGLAARRKAGRPSRRR